MIRKLSPSALLNVDVSTKTMRAVEWALTLAAIAYAAYDPQWYWIAFAVLALILTIVNPTSRIQKSIKGRFVKPARTMPFVKPTDASE